MTAVYDAWSALAEVHRDLIQRVAGRNGLDEQRLLKSSLLCVALHDVGKLSDNFQKMMRAPDEAAYRKAIKLNYRHEVAALWLVQHAASCLGATDGPIPGEGLLEVLAVAGHHKYLADGYLFDEGKFHQTLTWPSDPLKAARAACGLAREMFADRGWELRLARADRDDAMKGLTSDPPNGKNAPFDILLDSRDKVLRHNFKKDHARLRELFLLLKGLLMTADWMASGATGAGDDLDARKGVVSVDPAGLEDHLRRRVERRARERPGASPEVYSGYQPFQKRCGEANGHVIAIAPTGSGKTEASWLWALNQVRRGHARKIFVLLPTMVTANSLHDRLVAFFEEEHEHRVGLVHSTADLVRTAGDGETEADRADVRADVLSESHYFRPVTVGTVDQLLVPLFHAGRWAMKTFAAADSAIVIDEVHSYDPHTLGLVTLMIERLGALGARFMIMSATMPSTLRATLEAALAKTQTPVLTVEDEQRLDSARNVWEVNERPLTDWLLVKDARGRRLPSPEFLALWGIRNDRGEPLKILIVANTVKRCQDLARGLREFGFDLVCYHSKFIFEHRRARERLINDPSSPPRLVVATQVVEVSLDIDYDVLLTECAPIDALVQRAGRVNRARRPVLGKVVVHPAEPGSEKLYRAPAGVLDATWRACVGIDAPPTERDLIRMVEEVYEGFDPGDHNAFGEIRKAAAGQQERLAGVLDSPRPQEDDALMKTRKEDYPQVSVIPACFEAAAGDASPRERRLYELKVPVWYAKAHRVGTLDEDGECQVCRMGYDDAFGAELLPTKEHAEPGHMTI